LLALILAQREALVEREINGKPPQERVRERNEQQPTARRCACLTIPPGASTAPALEPETRASNKPPRGPPKSPFLTLSTAKSAAFAGRVPSPCVSNFKNSDRLRSRTNLANQGASVNAQLNFLENGGPEKSILKC
jgi:hypothetical protein